MGRMDFTPKSFRRNAGMEIPTAVREAFAVLLGVPGGGFAGAPVPFPVVSARGHGGPRAEALGVRSALQGLGGGDPTGGTGTAGGSGRSGARDYRRSRRLADRRHRYRHRRHRGLAGRTALTVGSTLIGSSITTVGDSLPLSLAPVSASPSPPAAGPTTPSSSGFPRPGARRPRPACSPRAVSGFAAGSPAAGIG